jgi:hypothetical protein
MILQDQAMQPGRGKFNCQAKCTTKESDKRAVHTLFTSYRLVISTGREMLQLTLETQCELQKSPQVTDS